MNIEREKILARLPKHVPVRFEIFPKKDQRYDIYGFEINSTQGHLYARCKSPKSARKKLEWLYKEFII